MRQEIEIDIERYEVMAGIVQGSREDNPGREERDKVTYQNQYGLMPYPNGVEYMSFARMVRFLVEVCGHSYEESLDAVIEHDRSLPRGIPRTDLNAEREAALIRDESQNIIESLFNLKVIRLIEAEDTHAVDYARDVTRLLMARKGAPRLVGPAA